jgi:ribosomal protein S6
MRNYQLVLVLRKSLTEGTRKKLLETIKGLLVGAKFTKEEEWGDKPLSYVIKKQSSAFFVNCLFETKEEMSKDFEKKLTAMDDVIRHLLLRSK